VSESLPALPPRLVSRALVEPLHHEPVEPDKVVAGSPSTGFIELGMWQGVDVGVWEMTPGSMVDIEVDEIFVVIAGEATLTRHSDGVAQTVELSPGVVCHLEEGEVNRWDVRVALRKIYFSR